MAPKVSAEMKRARKLLAEAIAAGRNLYPQELGKQVGLSRSAINKDAVCQELMKSRKSNKESQDGKIG